MTLLEAYRTIGPLVGDWIVDQQRCEAGRILLEEAQRICRRLRYPDDVKEDLPGKMCLKLLAGAVGGKAWRDPDSDSAVVGWLTTSLRNLAVDELRRRGQIEEVPHDDAEHETARRRRTEPSVSGHQTTEEEAREAEAEATWRHLIDELVPEIACLLPPSRREAFQRSVSEMLALAKEQQTMADVVSAQGKKPDSRTEAAVYQQHHRARARLLGYIDDLETHAQVSPERAEHLRNAVRSLRRRA
jgi:DNA-directed RNA polymerase specialized sigma24 family protein